MTIEELEKEITDLKNKVEFIRKTCNDESNLWYKEFKEIKDRLDKLENPLKYQSEQ